MIVIGIDPGYGRLGISIVEKKDKEEVLYSACIETDSKLPIPERIAYIGRKIEELVVKWSPNIASVEKLFFSTNQKTAISVAEVRGVVNYILSKNDIPIYEYTPLEIKTTITGHGTATKHQVADMVNKLVKIKKIPKFDDEFDAIAIALTCIARLPTDYQQRY